MAPIFVASVLLRSYSEITSNYEWEKNKKKSRGIYCGIENSMKNFFLFVSLSLSLSLSLSSYFPIEIMNFNDQSALPRTIINIHTKLQLRVSALRNFKLVALRIIPRWSNADKIKRKILRGNNYLCTISRSSSQSRKKRLLVKKKKKKKKRSFVRMKNER